MGAGRNLLLGAEEDDLVAVTCSIRRRRTVKQIDDAGQRDRRTVLVLEGLQRRWPIAGREQIEYAEIYIAAELPAGSPMQLTHAGEQ